MSVDIRFNGEPEEIAAVLAAMTAAGIEIAGTGREYPNRGGFGVSVYVEARIPGSGPVRATAERTETPPARKPVQRRRRGELGPGGTR